MVYDKLVKGATKIKMAAPKAKYIEPILAGTADRQDVEDIFRILSVRISDSAWTVCDLLIFFYTLVCMNFNNILRRKKKIVYKSLIVIHIMIREGKRDAALSYLSNHLRILDCKHITTSNADKYADSILRYSRYLQERAKQFGNLKLDYVRHKQDNPSQGRLRTLSVEKGLLREVESVQSQIHFLLLCVFHPHEVDDEISLTAFRLLVHDLLALHQAVNEGVINVLEHYFEMSRFDAERALGIYKSFVDEMDGVVEYLQIARKLESATKLLVPNIKHAPTSLTQALEDYLNDPDFDVNRRQFLAQKEAKFAANRIEVGHPTTTVSNVQQVHNQNGNAAGTVTATGFATLEQQQQYLAQVDALGSRKSPEQTLTDFFNSIDKEEPMFPSQQQQQQQQFPQVQNSNVFFQQQQQQLGQLPSDQSQQQQFLPQNTYAYQNVIGQQIPQQQQQQVLSQDFTGAGFGGYTSQQHHQLVGVFQQSRQGLPQQQQQQPQFSQLGGWNNTNGDNQSQAQPQSLFSITSQQQQQQQQQPLTTQFTGTITTNPFRQSAVFTGINPQFTGSSSNNGYNNGAITNTTSTTSLPISSSSLSNPFSIVKTTTEVPTSFGLTALPENSVIPVSAVATTNNATSVPVIVPQTTGNNPFAKNRLSQQLQPSVSSQPSSSSSSSSFYANNVNGYSAANIPGKTSPLKRQNSVTNPFRT
ncbi:ANTH domain-containing protein [Lipomyces japonicus]|uniref:ANTH domain-containing protein n=1 Tax=Lipomyces japonicus TaxID=56871 RepID=UPI0034CF6F80